MNDIWLQSLYELIVNCCCDEYLVQLVECRHSRTRRIRFATGTVQSHAGCPFNSPRRPTGYRRRTVVLVCGALLALGLAIVWRRPSPVEPVEFTYVVNLLFLFFNVHDRFSDKAAPDFTGPLAVNDYLKRGKLLFSREILAPESFVVDKQGILLYIVPSFVPLALNWSGRIYTGLGDGRVIRLDKDLKSFETILHTGDVHQQCGKY